MQSCAWCGTRSAASAMRAPADACYAGPTPLARAGTASSSGRGLDSHPMYPCAKLKLDQLFLQWLSLPDSQALVRVALRITRARMGALAALQAFACARPMPDNTPGSG